MDVIDDRFVRLSQVVEKTGQSRATIYRMIAAGTFPKQTPIGPRSVGWRLSEILQWMENPPEYHS